LIFVGRLIGAVLIDRGGTQRHRLFGHGGAARAGRGRTRHLGEQGTAACRKRRLDGGRSRPTEKLRTPHRTRLSWLAYRTIGAQANNARRGRSIDGIGIQSENGWRLIKHRAGHGRAGGRLSRHLLRRRLDRLFNRNADHSVERCALTQGGIGRERKRRGVDVGFEQRRRSPRRSSGRRAPARGASSGREATRVAKLLRVRGLTCIAAGRTV
jgi:hypothetical protein